MKVFHIEKLDNNSFSKRNPKVLPANSIRYVYEFVCAYFAVSAVNCLSNKKMLIKPESWKTFVLLLQFKLSEPCWLRGIFCNQIFLFQNGNDVSCLDETSFARIHD